MPFFVMGWWKLLRGCGWLIKDGLCAIWGGMLFFPARNKACSSLPNDSISWDWLKWLRSSVFKTPPPFAVHIFAISALQESGGKMTSVEYGLATAGGKATGHSRLAALTEGKSGDAEHRGPEGIIQIRPSPAKCQSHLQSYLYVFHFPCGLLHTKRRNRLKKRYNEKCVPFLLPFASG